MGPDLVFCVILCGSVFASEHSGRQQRQHGCLPLPTVMEIACEGFLRLYYYFLTFLPSSQGFYDVLRRNSQLSNSILEMLLSQVYGKIKTLQAWFRQYDKP